ncbi:MAG: hypothetical protein I3274_04150 [Candidatus Moeniiplasma glomeromycotorum]|nr:hypothetical protein [Candidatus Moeniiplasma glomeromycotorum]MCE8167871.1 hypothetical protein [Candidatus Moeniiplasma glomeromycotorum]
MNKLFIDPSATGTTGACLVNSKSEITLLKFENKDWKEHFNWIKVLVETNTINLIICEGSAWVPSRNKHISSLFKIIGAIEILPYFFPNLKVKTFPSKQTKQLRQKIINKEKGISGINYQQGKSWNYKEKNISTHELDAFLIYWIWKGNNYYE